MYDEACMEMQRTMQKIMREINRQAEEMTQRRNILIKDIISEALKPKRFTYEEYNKMKPIWTYIKDNTLAMEQACNEMIAMIKEQDTPPKKMINAQISLNKARVYFRKIIKNRKNN